MRRIFKWIGYTLLILISIAQTYVAVNMAYIAFFVGLFYLLVIFRL